MSHATTTTTTPGARFRRALRDARDPLHPLVQLGIFFAATIASFGALVATNRQLVFGHVLPPPTGLLFVPLLFVPLVWGVRPYFAGTRELPTPSAWELPVLALGLGVVALVQAAAAGHYATFRPLTLASVGHVTTLALMAASSAWVATRLHRAHVIARTGASA